MSAVRFFLFGKLRIEADTPASLKIESRKAEELLGFLLLNRAQAHSRERLADVLWGEISQGQSNNYLRKALWQLQSALENLGLNGARLLLVEGERLQVNPQSKPWLDVDIFENAFKQTQGILGRDLDEGQAQSIEQAVALYRGELLDDWYQDWCLYERERLQHLYLAMLDKLMDYCEMHGTYENGLVFGERILQYDRARERTHRRLMRLHYLAGDRTSALRQYQKCAAILQEELDVEPAQTTRLVHDLIRADKLESESQSSAFEEIRMDKSQAEPLRTIFSHLSAFQKELDQIQKQLTRDMQVIQRTLKGDRS